MMRICIVTGARPNFMKIAPIVKAIDDHNMTNARKIEYILVHTGQHYDKKMSKVFFEDLEIPKPDINLEVGSLSHAEQTAAIMKKFETVCVEKKPTHVLVVGDVNSTIACALVASKMNIGVVHVEAGLRSFDRTMPEEINRVLTDAIADILFTTEESANYNLEEEGIEKQKIHFVGNVMIDTLLKHVKKAEESLLLEKLNLCDGNYRGRNAVKDYAILTLHRPSNVDHETTLKGITEALLSISKHLPILFTIHPRTLKRINEYRLASHFEWLSENEAMIEIKNGKIYCLEPLGYLDFLHLMSHAKLVLTDSGGIQEETTILKVPCITIRKNTERPVTVECGTNTIVGTDTDCIIKRALEALDGNFNTVNDPPLWDGKAAERIVNILAASGV